MNMDYEQKYKEALERAKGHYGVAVHYGKEEEIQELEHIFPELIDIGKDERMKEMAIKAVHSPEAQSCIKSWGVNPNDVITWLEKQGEKKSEEKTKIYDSMDDLIADALIEEIESSELDDRGKYNRIHWIKSHM